MNVWWTGAFGSPCEPALIVAWQVVYVVCRMAPLRPPLAALCCLVAVRLSKIRDRIGPV